MRADTIARIGRALGELRARGGEIAGYVIQRPEQVVRLVHQFGAPTRATSASGSIPVLPVAGDGGGHGHFLGPHPESWTYIT